MTPTREPKLTQRIKEFAQLYQNPQEVDEFCTQNQDVAELADRFMSDLVFGTAGLRAEMGLGWNRMNQLTVKLATLGVGMYLKEICREGAAKIVIGHDHRHNSLEFANSSAAVLLALGHQVRVFDRPVPTPFVPTAIRSLAMEFGIMITASHNPKNDNGYKVYGSNGAQILDNVAKHIAAKIIEGKSQYPSIEQSLGAVLPEAGLIEKIEESYTESLKAWLSFLGIDLSTLESKTNFVYTPIHGVGGEYVQRIFKKVFGSASVIKFVPEQQFPDPDFPTVKFPNPEEGRSTLKLALKFAKEQGLKLVFANDPDADRFAVAADVDTINDWYLFTGNEIAVLLAALISERVPDSLDNCAMLASCVSSRFIEKLCTRRGWHFETTSTGFKNLGNRASALKNEGYRVLFAFEEAIGYQVGDWNFDKDGISALITFYALISCQEMARKPNTLDLLARLQETYEAEGIWPIQHNGYYFCRPASRIPEILSEMAEDRLDKLTFGSSTRITSIQKRNPIQIDFEFKDGTTGWLMLRSSGTEPKIKFYCELLAKSPGKTGNYSTLIEEALEHLLQPSINNLEKMSK